MTVRAEVRVWDPFVRIAHWLLAATVVWDWLTDRPLWVHSWLGYLAGLVGPEPARFVSFVRGPRSVFDYVAGLVRFSSPQPCHGSIRRGN